MFGHSLWCCPSSVGCLWCSWLGFGFGLLLGRVWFRGRCYWLGVAGFGWVVPLCLCGGPFFGAFWGGAWPPVVVLAGGLVAVGCFRAFSPSPLLFFLRGGGLACFSLCLSWAGARTGPHSVLSSGLLSSVAFCVAAFRPHGSGELCTRWARHPFLPG